jgi:hypothetical protein
MRRPALIVMLVLTSFAAACGGTVEPEDAQEASPPARQGLFLARTAGPRGPLTAYDSRSLGRRFQLPAGLTSPDGSAHFSLAGSVLRRFDPITGVRLKTWRMDGGWTLAAVSATARWVALVRDETDIRVLDGRTGKVAHDLELAGDFLVESVADDGSFLFLQQTFVDGRYAVRGYDLAARQMRPGSLATKGGHISFMQGIASNTVASPDGRWLLTLYVDTKRDAAFVHALNLLDRFPLCIDMPPCKNCTIAQLRRWALALAPDGRTLYATNPVIGRVAEVHLPSARVVYDARFQADRSGGVTRATVSPDGSRLLFTNGARLWSYDTHRGFATALSSGADAIADLGVSRDGNRLFVARPGQTPLAVEL